MKTKISLIAALLAVLLSSCESNDWASEVWTVQTSPVSEEHEFSHAEAPPGITYIAEAFYATYRIGDSEYENHIWFELGEIEGFEFEEGYVCELRVRHKWLLTMSPTENKYKLIKIVSKKPMSTGL